MIYIDLPCVAICTEEKCGERFDPTLVLLAAGGLGIKKPPDGWQILQDPQVLGGPYIARCPKHNLEERKIQPVKVQIGPAGRRLVTNPHAKIK